MRPAIHQNGREGRGGGKGAEYAAGGNERPRQLPKRVTNHPSSPNPPRGDLMDHWSQYVALEIQDKSNIWDHERNELLDDFFNNDGKNISRLFQLSGHNHAITTYILSDIIFIYLFLKNYYIFSSVAPK